MKELPIKTNLHRKLFFLLDSNPSFCQFYEEGLIRHIRDRNEFYKVHPDLNLDANYLLNKVVSPFT